MFYERKVIYLDYLVKNERCGNAGFIKIEVRGDLCNMTINVSNLHMTDSLSAKVYLIGGGQEQELCEVKIAQGKGMKCLLQQDMHDIGRTGITYEMLDAVRIPVGAEREIYGVVRERREEAEAVRQGQDTIVQRAVVKNEVIKNANAQRTVTENAVNKHITVGSAAVKSAEDNNIQDKYPGNDYKRELSVKTQKDDRSVQRTRLDNECKQEVYVRAEIGQLGENIHINKKVINSTSEQVAAGDIAEKSHSRDTHHDEPSHEFPLLDDKWKQLWAIYPHISPFHDEREYLSVGPNDFVILPGKYFKMANNSFLLHGYHNYKHLILKKMEYRGETRYYIGVPGNFYDREKQVAIMFGFESFESLEEPAQTGDYGYYLMRIEL